MRMSSKESIPPRISALAYEACADFFDLFPASTRILEEK